jgi:hypothetical protein
MTLREYLEALNKLPDDWLDSPVHEVPMCFLGGIPVAGCGIELCGYDIRDGTWKSPALIEKGFGEPL